MASVDDAGAVQNSYTYDVYGEPTVTGSLANDFDFAGQQTDGDTGLQYLRARYMDPETGVFFSRDPLAAMPSWLGSHFGYASGNPATATDPTGLCDDGSPACLGTDAPDCLVSWCYVGMISPVAENALYQWLEVTVRPDDLYWRSCWFTGEYTRCGQELSDTSWLSQLNPQWAFQAVMMAVKVAGWRSRTWTLDDGTQFQIPKDYKYQGSTDGGGGWFWKDAQGNTIRVMKPTAQNPTGYIRIQNSSGQYLDRFGNPVSTRDAAGHIGLGGGVLVP